jgi:glyoxylase-like metal-dependent hydrolase (beta-lactamase superfamily II)
MNAVAAGYQVIQVQDIRVTYLPDGVGTFVCDVFPGTDADCWTRHATQTADGRWVASLGGFLVESGDRKILVDLGFGKVELEIPDFATASSGAFLDNLARAGVTPDQIDTVVYTHMHADHTGWTNVEDALSFPNARHIAGPGEVAHWTPRAEEPFAPAAQLAFCSHFEESTDGEPVAPGVTIQHTPGHTPGHQVVIVSSGTARAVLLGDTIHCAAQLDEPEMTFMFDVDPVAARAWRESLMADLEKTGDVGGAGHFSGAALGRVMSGEGRRYWQGA